MNMPKGFYAAQAEYENRLPDDTEAEEARVAAWQQYCLERSDGSTLAMILNQEFASGEMVRFPAEFADINRTVKLLAEELNATRRTNGAYCHIHRLIALTNSMAESYAKVEGTLAAEQTTEWPKEYWT